MILDLHCVIDGNLIDEERARRGAVTCSTECGRELNRRKRNRKADKTCSLCGRGFRKSRTVSAPTSDEAISSECRAESAQVSQ
jgi:hypothetical protein